MKKFLLLSFVLFFFVACGEGVNTSYESPIPTDAPMQGNTYASVTITEYSNFACPACKQWAVGVVKPLIEEMGDNISFVFAHYPFALHGLSNGDVTAIHNSAECARDQGKFWEYHDVLFANQESLAVENIADYGVALELDEAQFNECSDNLTHRDKVRDVLNRGRAFGVTSTPTFFVNDQRFVLDRDSQASSLDQLKAAIEAAQ